MSKTFMRKEKGDTAIISIALSDWARYRQSGYVFVETDEDGNTPEQQFLSQVDAIKPDRKAAVKENGDDDDAPTMANKKPEIIAWLVENEIDHDVNSTKAELLQLIDLD